MPNALQLGMATGWVRMEARSCDRRRRRLSHPCAGRARDGVLHGPWSVLNLPSTDSPPSQPISTDLSVRPETTRPDCEHAAHQPNTSKARNQALLTSLTRCELRNRSRRRDHPCARVGAACRHPLFQPRQRALTRASGCAAGDDVGRGRVREPVRSVRALARMGGRARAFRGALGASGTCSLACARASRFLDLPQFETFV